MIKRLFSLLLISVLFTLSFSTAVSAQTYELSGGIAITLPENYTLLTDSNLAEHTETIAELGHSVASLRSYMKENHILFIGIDTQNQHQVQLGAYETDFSKDIQDLRGLKADDLETIGRRLINGSFEIFSIHDWIYFKTTVDGLAGYATVQYITLKNGILYTLNYYGSDSTVANEIASGLELPEAETKSGAKNILVTVLLWLALVAALITMVILLFSFVSDFRKSREDNDVRAYIKIKRRWKF